MQPQAHAAMAGLTVWRQQMYQQLRCCSEKPAATAQVQLVHCQGSMLAVYRPPHLICCVKIVKPSTQRR